MTIYQSPWRLSEVYLEISRTKQPGARFDNLHLAHPASPRTIRNKEKKKKEKKRTKPAGSPGIYLSVLPREVLPTTVRSPTYY